MCYRYRNPFDDLEALPLPYPENTVLRIREHVPPEPFLETYGPTPRPPVDWERWGDMKNTESDRVDFALANPPVETEPPGERERTLTVTGTITRRRNAGARVVTCFLDGDPSVQYVAKIYDGVYYPHYGPPGDGVDFDCMTQADRDYSIEAWAYRCMHPRFGGSLVPAYFGSWTFSLETGRPLGRERWVRMILLELVKGECMADIIKRAQKDNTIDYSLLPPDEFRIRVLQNLIEALIKLEWDAHVSQADIAPRNVIVKPDGNVVILDFNQATVWDFSSSDFRVDGQTLPLSPIEEFWPPVSALFKGMQSWIPKSWKEDMDLAMEWIVRTFRDSPEYTPPTHWFLDGCFHESASERVLGILESLGRKPAKRAGSPS